ncbi:MAG: hypothetical protein J07HQW2_00845 [Haloquadratum walsbyi J07HQW2]|uniref:Uncharacterized protein n=1 Tax=Haloquadratum walsbyi J07HQW2 TaxID=1238425 RepID=U1PQ30_9EURY|nr:MAG: hypothetical protein J07HQW2_00845 [Haloquadratum walsbyi J07HQW2]
MTITTFEDKDIFVIVNYLSIELFINFGNIVSYCEKLQIRNY